MGGHDQVSESQVDANKVEARLQGPVRNQEDRGSKERASDAYSSYRYINKQALRSKFSVTAKGGCLGGAWGVL